MEPDSFAFGNTIVSAVQVGRTFDGGAANIGWSTSTNGGASWTSGFLPGITTVAGGLFARVSDPSVAYDAKHNVWLIVSLPLSASVNGAAVVASRSTNGGTTWGNPVAVAVAGSGNAGSDLDKTWVACDNTPASPFYGRCYAEWDDFGAGNRIKMSTSADGGVTWGPARETTNSASGLGGQPVVQPNGTVVVPINNIVQTAILSFRSTDGGASWGATTTVSGVLSQIVAGSLRTSPLPSAEIDRAGKVYVSWQDCRFRSGCAANDIVMSSSSDGLSWSPVARIPIDPTTSVADHFIPGLAVDPSTSGSTARLGLAYYYYPNRSCTTSTCQLDVGFTSSADGGQTWTSPVQLAGPMTLGSLAATSQGPMVGDYISTSFVSGTARPFFVSANPPSGGVFDEALYTSATSPPTAARARRRVATAPVVSAAPQRAAPARAVRIR